ncbi:MAG: hypothetical protein O6761_01630 [Thaumarchaeota archaeon]|nr:hypothetical protein [Nitrososphaerota archaeon]
MYSRKALSQVLTAMIILVASVVLGTGVVIFGGSLFQETSLIQSISVAGRSLWVNSTDPNGVAWGAAGIRNTGDKITSITTISVRGTTVPFSNWYVDADQERATTANFQSQFINNGTNPAVNTHELLDSVDSGGSITTSCTMGTDDTVIELDFDGNLGGGSNDKPTLCLIQAGGPTTLSPGDRMIVYFKIPNQVFTTIDAGKDATISIFTSQTGIITSVTVQNP